MERKTYTLDLAGHTLTAEFGGYAAQANGAVMLHYGDTVVLVTACMSKEPREGIDFFPLLVDYEEKMYAVGKIPGSWGRREGKPTEAAVLNVKPAVDDSGIYFGAWDKKFYALSHDGQVIWQKKITENYYFSPSTGNPQISDDVVVFTSSVDKETGGLMALKKDTGEELWTKPILANYCTPLIHNGVVYVTDLSGKVYAFLLASGKELWTVNLENEIFSGQPLYYKEKIIVNMLRKSLAVIDLKTLEYKTIDVTRNYLLAAPRTDGQMVFIGAFDDKLHALKI
jgi:outer membrane protein assembly factor BamB